MTLGCLDTQAQLGTRLVTVLVSFAALAAGSACGSRSSLLDTDAAVADDTGSSAGGSGGARAEANTTGGRGGTGGIGGRLGIFGRGGRGGSAVGGNGGGAGGATADGAGGTQSSSGGSGGSATSGETGGAGGADGEGTGGTTAQDGEAGAAGMDSGGDSAAGGAGGEQGMTVAGSAAEGAAGDAAAGAGAGGTAEPPVPDGAGTGGSGDVPTGLSALSDVEIADVCTQLHDATTNLAWGDGLLGYCSRVGLQQTETDCASARDACFMGPEVIPDCVATFPKSCSEVSASEFVPCRTAAIGEFLDLNRTFSCDSTLPLPEQPVPAACGDAYVRCPALQALTPQ